MTKHAEPLRFHALDSLRASAMLLGIFLHMAWFFVPVAMAAPVVDRSANDWDVVWIPDNSRVSNASIFSNCRILCPSGS
jgi:hypothetical protein